MYIIYEYLWIINNPYDYPYIWWLIPNLMDNPIYIYTSI